MIDDDDGVISIWESMARKPKNAKGKVAPTMRKQPRFTPKTEGPEEYATSVLSLTLLGVLRNDGSWKF